TLSICLCPLENFHLRSNRLLSLLCSRNQALTENHYLTTGQSLIFPSFQNLLSVSSRTAFMNTCRITPCSIFSNLPTQSFIPLNLPYSLVIHDHLIKAMDRQQVTSLTLLCSHLVPVISILQVLFCLLS